MPTFDQFQNHTIHGSGYGYSGTRIDQLGACEYTLVAIAADVSSSVTPFQTEIESCVGDIVRACRRSPRADNLMLRLVRFATTLHEVHGFKPLLACDPADYDGALPTSGMTALVDATHNGVEALVQYGKALVDNDYDCNGILFVITDGEDNRSRQVPLDVRRALQKVHQLETLESLVTVLVGVNIQTPRISQALKTFRAEAGFHQYVEIDAATPDTLAKLADFVTRSISAQSVSLSSGSAPMSLSF